jgi:hypothetical protein
VQPVAFRTIICHISRFIFRIGHYQAPAPSSLLLLAPKPMSPDAMQMLEFLCLAFENITELNLFEIKID